ncbi:MAG: hypothetical protein C0478_10365 [Planctomyces sp.]|nr:hypothetical protein [Planctomyces sp.]
MLRTLRWMTSIVLLVGMAGAGGGAALYFRSDSMLREEALRQFTRACPDAKITLDGARFDFSGHIRLFNLQITPPGEESPLVVIPELIVTLDREQLSDHQLIVIEQLRVLQPHIHLKRRGDGSWNVDSLVFAKQATAALPELFIESGRCEIELETAVQMASHHAVQGNSRQGDSQEGFASGPVSTSIVIDDLAWTCLPVSAKQLAIRGEARVGDIGRLVIDDATVSIDERFWSVQGEWQALRFTQAAWKFATVFDPRLQQQWAEQWGKAMIALDAPAQTRLLPDMPPGQLQANLSFKASQQSASKPPEYEVHAKIVSGSVAHPAIPMALTGLSGACELTQDVVRVSSLTAATGFAQWSASGEHQWSTGRTTFRSGVEELELTDGLRQRLPPSLRKWADELRLTGLFRAECVLDHELGAAWVPRMTIYGREGTFRYAKFPYPVMDVSGRITVAGTRLDLEAKGMAGGVPVLFKGVAMNPGPMADAAIEVRTRGIAIDETLKSNAPPVIGDTLRMLRMEGKADLVARIIRPPGLGRKWEFQLAAQVFEGRLKCTKFPYELQQVNGVVTWIDDTLELSKVTAQHGTATLQGSGTYKKRPEGDRLELIVAVNQGEFDQSLYDALPPHLQETWRELGPRGPFDTDLTLGWSPGGEVDVAIPTLKLLGGDATLKQFPYPITDIRGELAYRAGELNILRLSGRHDDTTFRLKGFGEFTGGKSRVVFEEFFADDVLVTAAFRRAVPASLKPTLDALNPAGPFSVNGQVEFVQSPLDKSSQDVAWKVEFVLPGNELTTGLKLEKVSGKVQCQGTSVAGVTELQGSIDLDLVRIMGYQVGVVRGPFRLENGELSVGAKELIVNTDAKLPPRRIPIEERLSGKTCDGVITLDAMVWLNQPVAAWQMKSTISRASLERYAQMYLNGQSNLRGTMNGWMDLKGRAGDTQTIIGAGQLQISPAAIYELPIFVQMFRSLQLDGNASKAAFDYVDLNFRVADERFNFTSIDLVGSALSLRGRGSIRFDGGIVLDFYSMLARNQIRIPVIHEVVGALSRGWVGVEVRGNVGAPVSRLKPVPEFDDAMKQFLGAFNPANAVRPPPLKTFQPIP